VSKATASFFGYAAVVAWSCAVSAGNWIPLKADNVHDPVNPALKLLQNPAEGLSKLPSDASGNKVDWIRALQNKYINPRSELNGHKKVETLDTEILMNETGSTPKVLFPHKPHTEWLDCSNCHDRLFKAERGATPVTMKKILQGEYCGVCHGAVAFPLTECNRCHSVREGK